MRHWTMLLILLAGCGELPLAPELPADPPAGLALLAAGVPSTCSSRGNFRAARPTFTGSPTVAGDRVSFDVEYVEVDSRGPGGSSAFTLQGLCYLVKSRGNGPGTWQYRSGRGNSAGSSSETTHYGGDAVTTSRDTRRYALSVSGVPHSDRGVIVRVQAIVKQAASYAGGASYDWTITTGHTTSR